MDGNLLLPHELLATVYYHACDGFFPLPQALARSRVQLGEALRRDTGGVSEAKVVTALRARYRLVLRARGVCRAWRDAAWLPKPEAIFDWLYTSRKVLMPHKSYFISNVHVPHGLEPSLASSRLVKRLALRLKLAQPPETVLHEVEAFGGCAAMGPIQYKRLLSVSGLPPTTAERVMARRRFGKGSYQSVGCNLTLALIDHAKAEAERRGTKRVNVPAGLLLPDPEHPHKRRRLVLLDELEVRFCAPWPDNNTDWFSGHYPRTDVMPTIYHRGVQSEMFWHQHDVVLLPDVKPDVSRTTLARRIKVKAWLMRRQRRACARLRTALRRK